jgi:hypothetical protein
MAIMDFVSRFQALQLQRNNSDELIKVGEGRHDASANAIVTSLGFVDLLRESGNRTATRKLSPCKGIGRRSTRFGRCPTFQAGVAAAVELGSN